ncbi:NAD(P)H-hydrate epimerase [Enterobacter soli]
MTDHTVKKNPASIPHSIWDADDLRRAEKEAADSLGLTLYELMQRAGEAAFTVFHALYPQSTHWLILCGHGNNGGDGYVVARLAVAAGIRVTLLALENNKPLPEEAGAAREAWLNAGGVIHASDIVWPDDIDVIIDGLLGTGLRSAPREGVAALIKQANAHSAPVVALDIPSGLIAQTGAHTRRGYPCQPHGDVYRPQPGLLTGKARDVVGVLHHNALGAGKLACRAGNTYRPL